MSNKLSDWLPILQHPEVGDRICQAAGVVIDTSLDRTIRVFDDDSMLPKFHTEEDSPVQPMLLAALAFGTLEVLSDWDNGGVGIEIERVAGVWYINSTTSSERFILDLSGSLLFDVVLSAAKQVWMKGTGDE